jgi:cysteine desulfurase family protein (TIGR01976 family)
MADRTPPVTVRSRRRLFPALDGSMIRMDGPAASQVPGQVIEAVGGYLRASNANVGGAFPQSTSTEALVARARQRVAAFLGGQPEEVGFGLNATAVNARLARAAARTLQPGDEIVVTALDHDANIAPWREAAAERGLAVRTAGVTGDTRLDMAALADVIGSRTRIVAFPWANNITGTIVEVAQVARLAHEAGAIAWADAAHYAPHAPVDARAAGVDVTFGSAYKFFGPHAGVFYARRDLLEQWAPGPPRSTVPAASLEEGTLPFESLAGLVAALDYIEETGWEIIQQHERDLGARFLAGLAGRWRLHGRPAMTGRTATFALTLPSSHPSSLGAALAARGIAASTGHLHSPQITTTLGLDDGVVRIGLLHYNTADEVDRVLEALAELDSGSGSPRSLSVRTS